MPTVEQTIKQQFARTLTRKDWHLFKRMAEVHLRLAVFLKNRDIELDVNSEGLRLLARNCLKRLHIGIGVELVLKAAYLKHGYQINKLEREQPNAPAFPFTFERAQGFRVSSDKTYMLDDLIGKIGSVLPDGADDLLIGFKIAKVFRNKEGHTVFQRQKFDPSNYRKIEASLVTLYERAFREKLQVRFAVAKGERGLWKRT